MKQTLTTTVAFTLLLGFAVPVHAEEVAVDSLTAKLRAVGPQGKGHAEAIAATRQLSKAEVDQLPEILAGMKGASKLSQNWFRAVVETVVQRARKSDAALPVADLEKFLADTKQAPRARRLAYELVAGVDDSAKQRLIPTFLDDPSLELRRDAVADALNRAAALEKDGKKDDAVATYRVAFQSSRDLDQIKTATEKLRKLEQKVAIPQHMGFVMRWSVIGPFDNTDKRGFDVAYPPEDEVDLTASYEGKVGKVSWRQHVTSDDYGMVDLNVIYDRPKDGDKYKLTDEHKGAIAYAYSEFVSGSERDIELRMGCVTANKIWLNGEFLTANNVYHSNTAVDQYVATGTLKKGKNTILVKVCQNEMEQDWAQRWQFQLRVCDEIGTAVLSEDRPQDQTASLR